jgi:hypothetical protein
MSDEGTLGQNYINTKLVSISSESVAKFKYLEKKYNKSCLNSWENSDNVKFEEWLLPFDSATSVFQPAVQQHKNWNTQTYNYALVL